jgi:hypothetical protein
MPMCGRRRFIRSSRAPCGGRSRVRWMICEDGRWWRGDGVNGD